MEFHRFLPLLYDDISDIVWGMDRAPLGLYARRRESGKIITTTKEDALKSSAQFFYSSESYNNVYRHSKSVTWHTPNVIY